MQNKIRAVKFATYPHALQYSQSRHRQKSARNFSKRIPYIMLQLEEYDFRHVLVI